MLEQERDRHREHESKGCLPGSLSLSQDHVAMHGRFAEVGAGGRQLAGGTGPGGGASRADDDVFHGLGSSLASLQSSCVMGDRGARGPHPSTLIQHSSADYGVVSSSSMGMDHPWGREGGGRAYSACNGHPLRNASRTSGAIPLSLPASLPPPPSACDIRVPHGASNFTCIYDGGGGGGGSSGGGELGGGRGVREESIREAAEGFGLQSEVEWDGDVLCAFT